MSKQLILASQSPRRKELLAQLGYQFTCQAADIDESVRLKETPEAYVERLSREKVQHIIKNQTLNKTCPIVLGADTSVIFEQQILGKPADLAQCMSMLKLLSNNKHQVLTSIALGCASQLTSLTVSTDVYFKALTENEIRNYWATGEPQDKAGSYGIQGIGGQFVTRIQGSHSAVVGLPLYETANLLAEFGLPTPVQNNDQREC